MPNLAKFVKFSQLFDKFSLVQPIEPNLAKFSQIMQSLA